MHFLQVFLHILQSILLHSIHIPWYSTIFHGIPCYSGWNIDRIHSSYRIFGSCGPLDLSFLVGDFTSDLSYMKSFFIDANLHDSILTNHESNTFTPIQNCGLHTKIDFRFKYAVTELVRKHTKILFKQNLNFYLKVTFFWGGGGTFNQL